MSTVEIPKSLARDIVWTPVNTGFEAHGHSFKVIVNEQIDSSRWMAVMLLIVKIDDKFYEATYEKGLTEMQDSQPFEDEGDMISFVRVRPQPKTVIEYVPYPDGEL